MKLFSLSALLLFSLGFINSYANTPSTPAENSAIAYLEPRVHDWLSTRGCVSCHSVVPYTIGRITPDALQSTVYQEVITLVTDRTQNFDSMSPWYSGSHATQSKATESVLNALILTQYDITQGLTSPSAVTLQAFDKMKELQGSDGSWEWLDYGMEPWESHPATVYGVALASVAFARSGARFSPNYTGVIQNMTSYLVQAQMDPASSLWAKISILWAESEFGGILTKEQISDNLTTMLSKQLPSGGWSMNQLGSWKKFGTQAAAGDMTADGYASAYLAYVLKKLKASGKVPAELAANVDQAYSNALDWLVANQNAQGLWDSASLVQDAPFNRSLVEDAAAGFALAVFAD